MALMINQGKQDVSNDNMLFEPFEEKDVVGVVESLKLNEYLPGNIDVFFRLMTGTHKGQLKRDTISYQASSPFSWKYRSLRACCNEPYKVGEPENIDIEALIKDKVLLIDFTIREKDGKKNQNFSYKKIDQKHLDLAFPKVADDISEDDLPFNQSVVEEPTPEPNPAQTNPQVKQAKAVEPTPAVVVSNDDDEWE